MPTPTTLRWPKPTSEDEFEDIVLDFLRLRWDTPHVTRNGRRGQGQDGVDCFARVPRLNGRLGVAQCKNMARLSLGAVIGEVNAAKSFDDDTAEFLMVTAAERDEKLQSSVRKHFRDNPVPFTVDIVFWPDLVLELAGHPEIVRKHWGGFIQERAAAGAAAVVSASPRIHPGLLRLIEDYSRLFGGRDAELKALDAFLDGPRPCLLMRAPAGRGKTALLVHWVKTLRNAAQRDATPQNGGFSWDVVFHSISRRYQTATEHAVLYALASELAAAHGVSVSDFDTSPGQVKYVVADLLRREPPPDRHLVVIVDGIDEGVGWEFQRDLLPGHLPARTRLVLAARDMADRSEETWLDLLGWNRADTVHHTLPPLSHDSIASVVDSLPATPGDVASANLVDALERATEGDPLTMRFLIEALQQGELTVAELDKMPTGLASFIDLWMRDIEKDASVNDFAYALLGLLATAMAPLPIDVIEALAPDVFDRRMKVQQAVRAVARFIVGDGTARSGYVLSHPRLREIFFERLSPNERESASFSTIVKPTVERPIAVERTMRWDATGYGGHTEKATSGPATTWYFAEGSEGFFRTFLLLANPQPTANVAHVKWLREGATAIDRDYNLLPSSRTTIGAIDDPELVNQAFGITVTFDQPGVAERAMYFGGPPLFKGGHESAGVTAPSTTWLLAEGATGDGFETFILVSNPGSEAAEVTFTFLPSSGAPASLVRNVPANSRITVNPEREDLPIPLGPVGTQVTSTQPVIAERAQYWPLGPVEWTEAHNSFGVTEAATHWALAEGRVGGSEGYQTYILLANPGNTTATVQLQYLEDGQTNKPLDQTVQVPAQQRVNVPVPNRLQNNALATFGTFITSDHPIVVERALYWNVGGETWAAGTNATATKIHWPF